MHTGKFDRLYSSNLTPLNVARVAGTDILRYVRFTLKSGHWNSVVECPLCAKSGLMHCSKSCHRGRRRRTLIHFGLEWRPRSGPHCPSQSAATAARAPPTMDRMFMMARRPRQTATELRVIGLGYEVVSRTA